MAKGAQSNPGCVARSPSGSDAKGNSPDRGRVESPASGFGAHCAHGCGCSKQNAPQGDSSSKEKADALEAFLNHPFWASLPKALHGLAKHIDTTQFSKPIFDRLMAAMTLVTERGWKIGPPEEAFLVAARAEFGENKGFLTGTAVSFLHTIEKFIDPSDAIASLQDRERQHADLVHFIFRAAHEKPELLCHLDDRSYEKLDPSVVNNPHLEALIAELVSHKCLTSSGHVNALKLVLSKLRANWTEERCKLASEYFKRSNYLADFDFEKLRTYVWDTHDVYPTVAEKIWPVMQAHRITYSEEMVLRLEAICYIMHTARLDFHA